MPNSFQNIFGGITIYPSDLGFIDYTLTQSAVSVWPTLGESSSFVAASFTRIVASNPGIVYTLPDADHASVGNALRYKNNGSTTFNIASASGSVIATMSAGQDILLSITDNTTSGGLWDASYIGSGTTSANASALAGTGLTVSGSTLDACWPVVYTGSSGYLLTTTSNAHLITWTGGTGNIGIDIDGGTRRNGYMVALKNQGTGVLTVSGRVPTLQPVDGSISGVTLNPNDSTFLFGDGTNSGYYTVGLTNNNSDVGVLQIDASTGDALSTGIVTLTAAQANNKVFIITNTIGNALNNLTIILPQVSGEFIVSNQSHINALQRNSGGFVTIRTSGSGTSVQIPVSSTRTIWSDGTNISFSDDLTQRRPAQNLLYFADFSKNPWQRGITFTSSSVIQYTADRVSVVCTSGVGFQISRVASTNTGCQYDMRIQRTTGAPAASGTTLYLGFDLPIEESIPLRGQNTTLAMEVSTGSSAASLPSWILYTSTGSNQKILTTLASGWNIAAAISQPIVSSASGYYRFEVNPGGYSTGSPLTLTTALSQVSVLCQIDMTATGANDYINISRVALVQGTFSSFDNVDAGDALNKCQRYAYAYTASAAGSAVAAGQAISSNSAIVPIQFPTTMRTAPALTITAANFQVTTSTGAGATCTSIAINTSGATQYNANLLVATTTALLSAGNATQLQALTSTGSMIFSADI